MRRNARATILHFAASRPDGTTCPSEVARVLAKDDSRPSEWRKYMPVVHEAVDALNARGGSPSSVSTSALIAFVARFASLNSIVLPFSLQSENSLNHLIFDGTSIFTAQ